MSSLPLNAPDLPQVITPKRHLDPRGWFSETYHEQRLDHLGIRCRFVQDNQSYSSRAGTLRGLHFQRPPHGQAKLIMVLRGRILDVVVDLRRGSSSYGRHVSVEIAADVGQQVYIPVGFAHGFLTLTDDVLVMYKVSDYYAPDCDGGIRWDDSDIGVHWPMKPSDLIVSEKDSRLPRLAEFDSPFAYDGHPLVPLTSEAAEPNSTLEART
jgi:dTDP-4-dehydrorhamnose 3,5-epimerase